MEHLTLQVLRRGRWVDVGNRRGRSSAIGAARLRQRRHPAEPVRVVDRAAALVLWPVEEVLVPDEVSRDGRLERPDGGDRGRPRRARRPASARPPPDPPGR